MLWIWEPVVVTKRGVPQNCSQASYEIRGISSVDNTPGPTAAERSGSQQAMFMTWSFVTRWEVEEVCVGGVL